MNISNLATIDTDLNLDLLETAFNASPNPMVISKLSDGCYIKVNRAFLAVSGFSREEVIGHTSVELNIWEDLNERKRVIELLQQNNSLRNFEAAFRMKSGELKRGLLSAEVVVLTGEKCVLFSVNDITNLVKLQHEVTKLDRLNLIGQMAASIGHEIRNPITAVRGFLQLLCTKSDIQHYKDFFDLMIGELDRANMIIKEYLSLAKDKKIELTSQNLNSIINAVLPLLIADATKNDYSILTELTSIPDLPLNEEEIRQLILNLVRNGLEAMTSKGCLMIKTYIDEGEVVLSVHDQGKGIPPGVLEKIGTPFFTTKEDGTGLGLAVCYRICARHNACIKIETSGNGSVFNIRFRQNLSFGR